MTTTEEQAEVTPLGYVTSTTPFDRVPEGGQYSFGSPIIRTIAVAPAVPTSTQATITYSTDIAGKGTFTWWPAGTQRPPDPVSTSADTGQVIEGTNVTSHSQAAAAGLVPGRQYNYDLKVTDTGGTNTSRTASGTFFMPGARAAIPPPNGPQAVTTRFYNYGSSGTPPAGGGSGTLAGNWSTYTWAQYNPKNTSFPS